MSDFPISTGSVQNPYKQFSFSVAPQATYTLYYVFDFFRILSVSGNSPADFKVRFGETGSETDLIGAGIGYKLTELVRVVTFRNTSVTDTITFTVAVAVGTIFDDRLNVSGTVIVTPATGACFSVANCEDAGNPIPLVVEPAPGESFPVTDVAASISASSDVSVSATTSTQIVAANSSRKGVILSNLQSNTSVVRFKNSGGALLGAEVPIGASIFLPTTAAVVCYNPGASSVSIGVLELI